MSSAKPTLEVNIDPQNPAQFFACCGLFELASVFSAYLEAYFDYKSEYPRLAVFKIYHSEHSLSELIYKLRMAKSDALKLTGDATVTLEFDNADNLCLDWWLKYDHSKKSRFKLWAGQQTTLNLVKTMQSVIPDSADKTLLDSNKVPMSGRFGLDPRSAWNSLDFGSSVNEQGRDAFTFPAAEILAAIGLQGFRPYVGSDGKSYVYTMWTISLPLSVARAAVCGALPVKGKTFSFQIEKRSGAYSCFTFSQPT